MFFRKKFDFEKFYKKIAKADEFDFKPYMDFEEELIEEYGRAKRWNSHLRLLVIADTHGGVAEEDFAELIKEGPSYDACIMLGDHTPDDIEKILRYVPKEKIIGVLGNHDSFELYKEYGIKDINGKIVEIAGVRFAGIQGSFRYKDEKYPLYTQKESIDLAEEMEEADVLISHDMAFNKDYTNVAHAGLAGILYYIYKSRIAVHIYGHYHKNSEKMLQNGTKEIGTYMYRFIEI